MFLLRLSEQEDFVVLPKQPAIFVVSLKTAIIKKILVSVD